MLAALIASAVLTSMPAQATEEADKLERSYAYLNRAMARGNIQARVRYSRAGMGTRQRPILEWQSGECEAQFATRDGRYSVNFRDVSDITNFFNMITLRGPVQGSSEPSSALILDPPGGETFENTIAALKTIKEACPDTL